MYVLKPQLLWVGKRCYRVNSVANDDNLEQQQPDTNEYIEDGRFCHDLQNLWDFSHWDLGEFSIYYKESRIFDKFSSFHLTLTDLYGDDGEEAEVRDELEIIEVSANRFKTMIHVPM